MPSIDETKKKLVVLAKTKKGWHYGSGVRPHKATIVLAGVLLDVAKVLGTERANAFLGLSGEVQITLHHRDRMLEINLETDKTFTIAEDLGDEQIQFLENQTVEDVAKQLVNFAAHLWKSSESFITNTTIPKTVVSQAVPSKDQKKIKVSRSSTKIALQRQASPVVNISSDFIWRLPASQQFIGKSSMTGFQTMPC